MQIDVLVHWKINSKEINTAFESPQHFYKLNFKFEKDQPVIFILAPLILSTSISFVDLFSISHIK